MKNSLLSQSLYKSYSLIMIFLVLLATGNVNSAFALTYAPVLTVEAKKITYDTGEEGFVITGMIASEIRKSGEPVLIEVFNPMGELYDRFKQFEIRDGGDYGYTFKIGKSYVPGDYEILVTYNGLQAMKIVPYLEHYVDSANYRNYVVKVGNQTFPIRCKIQGTIDSILADQYNPSLYLTFTSITDHGKLTVEIPKNFIDAKNNGSDTNYFVGIGVGGFDYNNFKEIQTTADKRTLEINLVENGTNNIIIRGTQMLPEFGTISTIVLAMAISGIIIISTRKFFLRN